MDTSGDSLAEWSRSDSGSEASYIDFILYFLFSTNNHMEFSFFCTFGLAYTIFALAAVAGAMGHPSCPSSAVRDRQRRNVAQRHESAAIRRSPFRTATRRLVSVPIR